MFLFDVAGATGGRASIRIQALDWAQSGPVIFQCDDDALAVVLLSGCRCDSVGFFNLLAGCKPLYVEQWLAYLQESGRIGKWSFQTESPADSHYLARAGLDNEELNTLLAQVYQVAGFNRLQINRYLKKPPQPHHPGYPLRSEGAGALPPAQRDHSDSVEVETSSVKRPSWLISGRKGCGRAIR